MILVILTESLFLEHVLQLPGEGSGTAGRGTVVCTLHGQLSWQGLGEWAWGEGGKDGDTPTLATGGCCLTHCLEAARY